MPGRHSRPSSGWLWAVAGSQARSGRRRSLVRELPVLVVFALVIAMVIKTFVVQAFVIPSGSMQNTLAINDKILVNKLVYHFRAIKPGDIVVFDGAGTLECVAGVGSRKLRICWRGRTTTRVRKAVRFGRRALRHAGRPD